MHLCCETLFELGERFEKKSTDLEGKEVILTYFRTNANCSFNLTDNGKDYYGRILLKNFLQF